MTKDEFLKKIKATHYCSNWPGGTDSYGYGSARVVGVSTLRAPRIAYILTKGDIQDNMVVRHTCDNPLCINPDHLVLGSQKDNVDDLVERGKMGTSKLSKQEVIAIIKGHYNEGKTGAYLGRQYKVSNTAVCEILKGNHYPKIFLEVYSELKTSTRLDWIVLRIHKKERTPDSL
jgi:hypothetical protein